jgi:mono/diheme cytochrome c family protein
MTKNIYAVIAVFAIFLASCGSGANQNEESKGSTEPPKSMIKEPESYDPNRGEGKFSAENVILGALDASMVTKGEAIAGTKCTSCHKLTDERLVGPGWKGVTERRTPHWIMNFITNPDPMINKDPELQAQLELCLVRMPNQNLADEDARSIVEFMRKIDGAN